MASPDAAFSTVSPLGPGTKGEWLPWTRRMGNGVAFLVEPPLNNLPPFLSK